MKKVKLKDINKLKPFLRRLISEWDTDDVKVKNNCLLNTVSLDFQLKFNFINQSRMCCGAVLTDKNIKIGHFWNEIKIKNQWKIVDITAFSYNDVFIPEDVYMKNEGGFFDNGEFVEPLMMKKMLEIQNIEFQNLFNSF